MPPVPPAPGATSATRAADPAAAGHEREMAAYRAAVDGLSLRGRYGIRLGLGRTRGLLRELGQPQLSFGGALIGGTNGKGSVQALVGAMLARAGYRVGQTPKPHLIEYRERILVGGEQIAPADFARLIDEVLVAADRVRGRLGPPTEFELLTAAAFTWFARSRVDLAVVEVGLGGRLDSTNVWDGGVAAITNVSYDHMDRLGPTLTDIAREKAAIIKRGDRAVTGASGEGLVVIRRRARRMGVALREVAPLPVIAQDRRGLLVAHDTLGEVRLGLLGRHQAANAAVALAVVDGLEEAGLASVAPDARRAGLAEARWPGRLELLTVRTPEAPESPAVEVVLDGAHNEAGVGALLDALAELRPHLAPGRVTLLFGLMADKDVGAIASRLAGHSALRGAAIVTTQALSARALAAADLADALRRAAPGADVHPVVPAEAALRVVLEHARREAGPLVVAGSLYLVGQVRGLLSAAADPQGG